MQFRLGRALLVVLVPCCGALVAGCPRPGAIEIASASISTLTPQRGDEVTLRWELLNASGFFVLQEITFLVPTLLGLKTLEPIELDGGDRSFTFTYERPVTVVLTATSTNAANLGSDRLLIDINDSGNNFFRGIFVASDPERPKIGVDEPEGQREISFSSLGAWFELEGDIDDPFVIDGLRGFFEENGNVFRQRQFLITPDSLVREPGGIAYPALLDGTGRRANAMIFGAALAYSGIPIPLKVDDDTDEDEELAQRLPGIIPLDTVDPIYMLISARFDFLDDGIDDENAIVEIEVGNTRQGLTCTTFGGVIENSGPLGDPRFLSAGGNIFFDAEGGRVTGNIKNGKAGAAVAPGADAFIDYISVEFDMPAVRDDQLFTLFGEDLSGPPPID